MNCFSAKVHMPDDYSTEDIRDDLNKELPDDIRVFGVTKAHQTFNSKKDSVLREYDYYMPSFLFSTKFPLNYTTEDITVPGPETENPLKKLKINVNKTDSLSQAYSYRMLSKTKKKIEALMKMYKGSHRFHNFTIQNKKIRSSMEDLNVREFRVVNTVHVVDGIEYVRIAITGRGFLFQQILKMVGAVSFAMRNKLGVDYVAQTLSRKRMQVPSAPSEGLVLNAMTYDWKMWKMWYPEPKVRPWEDRMDELKEFRHSIVKEIGKLEKSNNTFSEWSSWTDHMKKSFLTPIESNHPKYN